MIDTIAFDGDDTLWHNETMFSVSQRRFRALMAPYVEEAEIDRRLLATEVRNLGLFGYGVKGFTLSMIETAIELSDGRISAAEIHHLLELGKSMLDHPVELLDGVRETVEALSGRYRLIIVTKGDLFDQESKVARSGLADLFDAVEIVSEKDEATYRRILRTHAIAPETWLMVGNSLRSDILPVLALGGHAVHVAYPLTWAHEVVELPRTGLDRLSTIGSMRELPPLLERLTAAGPKKAAGGA